VIPYQLHLYAQHLSLFYLSMMKTETSGTGAAASDYSTSIDRPFISQNNHY